MRIKLMLVATAMSALALNACSSSRDVEVTGQVSGAATQGDIAVSFFDIKDDEQTRVHDITLQRPATFREDPIGR